MSHSNSNLRWVICGLILLVCPVATMANRSHPISVTRTYAYVTREMADVKIEVFLEDLFLFHDLKPNDEDFLEPDVIRQGVELHKEFLLEKFVIRDATGERLTGEIVGIDDADLPPEGVPLAELMAHTIVFQLQYNFTAPPEFLTISQHFTDAQSVIPSEMNLVLKQETAGEAHTAELLPNEPDTVRFSWNNPPLSPEASEAERKKWVAKQQEETLGITSYSSVYSFLYIDDYEVRHEILIPLLTLEESILIARDDDEFLDLAEQDAARQQIEAYFTTGNPIEIDGVEVKPKVERCDFYGLNFKDFAKQAERRPVGMASARVGIILSYSTKGTPDSVKLTWNRFNNYIWTINMVVFAFDDVSRSTLSRLGASNQFNWKNAGRPELPPLEQVSVQQPSPPTLSLPVVSLCCLGLLAILLLTMKLRDANVKNYWSALLVFGISAVVAWPFLRGEVNHPFYQPPPVTDLEAEAVFIALHKNIYRAFDYRNEEDVYDALSKSIDGELLEQLYLQIRRGLEMQEQGGAISKIREVKIIEGNNLTSSESKQQDAKQDGRRRFRFQSRWNVSGTVEHWGHIHARTNQYEASFVVEARGETWKIVNMELLEEKRVKFETSLRTL